VYLLQKQLKENANKTTGTVTTIRQMTTPKKINKNTQPWFDLQLDALNSCLVTCNTFIKLSPAEVSNVFKTSRLHFL
jgi:hypothetical protein